MTEKQIEQLALETAEEITEFVRWCDPANTVSKAMQFAIAAKVERAVGGVTDFQRQLVVCEQKWHAEYARAEEEKARAERLAVYESEAELADRIRELERQLEERSDHICRDDAYGV